MVECLDSPGFHLLPPQKEGWEGGKEGGNEGRREEGKHREAGKKALTDQGEGWLKVSS